MSLTLVTVEYTLAIIWYGIIGMAWHDTLDDIAYEEDEARVFYST